jgi:hypothetical protein
MDTRKNGFFKILSAYEQYNKCVKKHCKAQVDALEKVTKTSRDKISTLRSNLLDGKLTPDKFKKEIIKIMDQIHSLEESKKLTECSLSKCKKEFINFLDISINELESDKSRNPTIKQTIQQMKVIRKKVTSDKLDDTDYDKLLKLINKLK